MGVPHRDNDLDMGWLAVAAVAAGWLVAWPAVSLLAARAGWTGPYPTDTAVSAMATWLVAVLLAFAAWGLIEVLRRGPAVELAEPGFPMLRRWWVPPAFLAIGLLLGWWGWK